jgi:thioredoxin-related protein
MVLSFMSLYSTDFLEDERTQALAEKKLILLTVSKEHCPYCLQMRHDVFETPRYNQAIEKHYVHIEIDKNDPILPESLHVKYYPTNIILHPTDLKQIDEFIGYTKPDIFVELLDEVYAQELKSFSNTQQPNKKPALQK